MNTIRLAENLTKLRRSRGVTQGEMADFIGVTKASVSKWENGLSMPDILLLPQIASYFGVTVDDLLGYEPQLAKEQIRKIYYDLAADFANLPFENVMAKSEALVKRYYSCFPFLNQMVILWMNHFIMAESNERQEEILQKTADLCDHILEHCKDMGINRDTVMLKAAIDLQRGHAQEVIQTVGDLQNPCRISSQGDSLLIQAYRMAGEREKADSFTQVSMFLHLLLLLGDVPLYLAIHEEDKEICEETIRRTDVMIREYHLERIAPNAVSVYEYQAAVILCAFRQKEEALARLKKYAETAQYLLKTEAVIQGDEYFYRLDEWVSQTVMVRNKRMVLESVRQSLENPAFDDIRSETQFVRIQKQFL
ncbi:MAG: helix-turn-helix transcriptional regulator [Lachnospiraceae bacterium]|nr:helix-turn-helix transcriptional regulator [Lachnospiraceae bacterium]